MKILMVSMFSNHFFRWVDQLEEANHEVRWVDVFDSNTYVNKIDFVDQIVGWRNRWNYPGRYSLKSSLPYLSRMVDYFNQRDLADKVKEEIINFQPDVIHSFVLQSATLPLINIMYKFPNIKWIYSAWGNDLYYRQNFEKDKQDIQRALPHLDYMFADCTRDYFLARKLGFQGTYLGTYPTGGGYKFHNYNKYLTQFSDRNLILIKGYQGKLGRCNKVLESLIPLKEHLGNYVIKVYGGNEEVSQYADKTGLLNWDNFEIFNNISHIDVLKLMGKSLIAIGNNISDGLPNTLLEAIIMECYPIQSNPGGASSELIADGENGSLIQNPENAMEIKNLILNAIENPFLIKNAIDHNTQRIKPFLERNYIRNQVLKKYDFIEAQLKK
jgi:glycosyltransferase involved in cell wall biosynthesis